MSVPNPDRRSNLVLRALIDDMLERVRMLNRDSVRLTDAERELAEADLDGVMAHVRRLASHGPVREKEGSE
ncbi:MAG TPA: hypothetical protein VE967_17585 [Gemmatimonadaceae bacterium]|nr:hypothetical protein [Gemmatimonadaceae bacterium]